MNEPFRMNVKEVFHFQDGTTVFAGEVTEGPDELVYPPTVQMQTSGFERRATTSCFEVGDGVVPPPLPLRFGHHLTRPYQPRPDR